MDDLVDAAFEDLAGQHQGVVGVPEDQGDPGVAFLVLRLERTRHEGQRVAQHRDAQGLAGAGQQVLPRVREGLGLGRSEQQGRAAPQAPGEVAGGVVLGDVRGAACGEVAQQGVGGGGLVAVAAGVRDELREVVRGERAAGHQHVDLLGGAAGGDAAGVRAGHDGQIGVIGGQGAGVGAAEHELRAAAREAAGDQGLSDGGGQGALAHADQAVGSLVGAGGAGVRAGQRFKQGQEVDRGTHA